MTRRAKPAPDCPVCRRPVDDNEHKRECSAIDLHRLMKREGDNTVATAAGVSVHTIRKMRGGQRQVTTDANFALMRRWPDYDPRPTILLTGWRRSRRA